MAALAGLAGLLVAAPSRGQAPTVRDSAGVRIVENPSRLRAPVVFRIGDTPRLKVGGLESNPLDEFNHQNGMLRPAMLGGGNLGVIDENRLHFFDSRGKRTQIVGREGAGPKEFHYLGSICQTRGDSLVLGDSWNHRVAILDAHGDVVRTIAQMNMGNPPFDACFDDGTFIMHHFLPRAPGGSMQVRITRLNISGKLVQVLGDFPVRPITMVAMSEPSVLAAGKLLYLSDVRANEVHVYSNLGRLQKIVRTDDPLTTISDAEFLKLAGAVGDPKAPAAQRALSESRARRMGQPKAWPGYGKVLVDPDGVMWVQDFLRSATTPEPWTAFDTSGFIIGRLTLPAPRKGERPANVISFGHNEILLRTTDADGARYFSVYPLLRISR